MYFEPLKELVTSRKLIRLQISITAFAIKPIGSTAYEKVSPKKWAPRTLE